MGQQVAKHGRNRRFHCESLEPRLALSTNPLSLVPVGQQPDGALSGKIVYTHAGHGITADNLGNGAWSFQRPELFEMIEDLGNQDQQSFFADYLFRAGATVVPLRPVGHQPNEVVLDNDDPGVSFIGNWSNSSSSIYYGDLGDVPYRFASTSSTETAFARYRPNIPEEGFYPVYSWTRSGSDRAGDHLYRVHHSGGITEVTVNHRRVGNGLVYLGTYHFGAGTNGWVDISNRSTESGRVVIADMIRFGNGMGDISRGGGVSGMTRENEAGLYWVKWHVDRSQGIPDSEYRASSSDRSATVSLSPRYAEYMNRSQAGTLSDRVFISFHSNAGGGGARGVLGLYNGNNTPSSATPNQFQLANIVATEVRNDMVSQAGDFEHFWLFNSTVTLDRSDIEFGEINNTYIQNEFDATIIETGYHDNQLDAEMLRDPKVRDALARSTYQGVVKYFNFVDGTTPITMLPAPVTNVMAEGTGVGSVELTWDVPEIDSARGDAPTGFRIYTSTNGYGFDGGTVVSGGTTTSHQLAGLDPNTMYYFKIVAENAGGESVGSTVVAAQPSGSDTKVLVVNGFDRYERRLNPREQVQSRVVDRVRPRFNNSFDYSVQVGEALASYSSSIQVDSAQNESVADLDVSIFDYDALVWILGEESSADETFSASEQTLVSAYLSSGGNLFLSGAEVGWDLDQLNNGRTFYNNDLKANYVADDASTYSAAGVTGSIFDGIDLTFDDGSLFYDVTFPDVISPLGGATSALQYVGGTGGTAAIQFDGGMGGHVVNFGFPFETITATAVRADVMERVMDFFEIQPRATGDFDDDGDLDCDDLQLLAAAIAGGSGDLAFDVNDDAVVDAADVLFWITDIRMTLPGDANLDGFVDTSDFNIWNDNKFSTGTYWCTGDFTGDGITDASDFNVWNSNKFTSAMLTPELPTFESGKAQREIRSIIDRVFAEPRFSEHDTTKGIP